MLPAKPLLNCFISYEVTQATSTEMVKYGKQLFSEVKFRLCKMIHVAVIDRFNLCILGPAKTISTKGPQSRKR